MDFNLILNGKDEFYPKLNNKTYQILVIDNEDNEKYMFQIVNNFNKGYIGIDLEFNHVSKEKMDVALMQINLEDDTEIGHIFLLDPVKLSDENYNNLISLLTRNNIIKIVHGSESLDVTYLFNQLLITKENINKFCNNLYDTRYLCEYYKILNESKEEYEKKISCGIYNLLILLNIITPNKLNELDEIEEKMGIIWLIKIDVYNLSLPLLKYALYDVIYLPQLLKKFLDFNDIYYTKIIPELTSLVYKYKKNIENQFTHLEKLIGKMNINFIYVNNKRYLLQEIFEIFNSELFNKIKEINYFRNFFKIITKLIIYNNLYNKYKIYTKNNNHLTNINFDFYFNWLSRYKYINYIICEYSEIIKENI
jgi:hypothetical protein